VSRSSRGGLSVEQASALTTYCCDGVCVREKKRESARAREREIVGTSGRKAGIGSDKADTGIGSDRAGTSGLLSAGIGSDKFLRSASSKA
jgi:hypothetical protein